MKLAFISSIRYLSLCDMGTMEMALAPLVLQSEAYADRYRKVALEGKHVILDNGAFEMQEMGRGVDAQTLIMCAKRVSATEVICPDVLYDGPGTVRETKKFIESCYANDPLWFQRTQFMAVAQGRTPEEFLKCADELKKTGGVSILGMSKLSVPACFGREFPLVSTRTLAVNRVLEETAWGDFSVFNPTEFIHLLGGDWSLPLEILAHSTSKRVRSNDSSFAYWYGNNCVRLDPTYHIPVDTNTRLRYISDRPDLHTEVPSNLKLRSVNIARKLLSLAGEPQ